MHKKFISIFILFVVVPISGFIYLPSYLESNIKGFYPADHMSTLLSLLWISILACGYILFDNYTTKKNSILWYILGTVFGVGSILFWYLFYSLSNIGF